MKKIAVVNRTNLINYGSVLQCYALCEAIKNLGYESEIIWEQGNLSKNFDFRPIKIFKTMLKLIMHPSLLKSTLKNIKEVREKEINPETVKLFSEFVENNIHQKKFSHKEMLAVAHGDEYYKLICGSDQVWCSTTTYVDPLMYLRFAPKEKRIAYAPSIGRDYIPKYNRRQMRKYIKDIPYVSIREDDGKRLIKELTGREVPVVLDPTLLLARETWESLKNKNIYTKRPYLLCYFLDTPCEKTQKSICSIAADNNLKIISIGRKLDIDGIDNPICGPSEFLSYASDAELVVTDSYHGMLFSMIFERQFWSIKRDYQQFDQSSRQLTILNRLNLKERYLEDASNLSLDTINYNVVNSTLRTLRKDSLNYLLMAIENQI